jgi:hypothetical protein
MAGFGYIDRGIATMALENGWFITTDDELLELRLGLIVPIASRSPSRRMIRPPSHFI